MGRFEENGFEPIDLGGRLVHPMYRASIAAGDSVRIEWLGANSSRVQGLTLRIRIPGVGGKKGVGGQLKVDDSEGPAIILWMDSAPPEVVATCVSARTGSELQISNRWRLEDGREDEWLNNYGIIIDEQDDGSIVLRCSDGYGQEPSFDDLCVRVNIERASCPG